MTVVVDANIAIATLNPDDAFHRAAIRRCLEAGEVHILNLTRAEALIHPTRLHLDEAADAELDRLNFVTHEVTNDIADRARRLRAEHGNRNFPLVDAIVVAFGIERDMTVITADAKWPGIVEADVEILSE